MRERNESKTRVIERREGTEKQGERKTEKQVVWDVRP